MTCTIDYSPIRLRRLKLMAKHWCIQGGGKGYTQHRSSKTLQVNNRASTCARCRDRVTVIGTSTTILRSENCYLGNIIKTQDSI